MMYQLIKEIASGTLFRYLPCEPRDLDGVYDPNIEHPIISPAELWPPSAQKSRAFMPLSSLLVLYSSSVLFVFILFSFFR